MSAGRWWVARILVVGERLPYFEHLRDDLRAVGHDVVAIRESKSTLSLAATYEPDVVVIDVPSPARCSLVSCRLRSRCPGLSVVVFSANSEYGHELEGAPAAVIVRSSNLRDLVKRVMQSAPIIDRHPADWRPVLAEA
jgi:DNA-binding response OmpR family regulator